MVKICSHNLWGLIDGHRWIYNFFQDKRVCSKCGWYEKLIEPSYYIDYDDGSYWSKKGVVDYPEKLIKKWGQEIKHLRKQKKRAEKNEAELKDKMKESEAHHQVKWEDA